MVEVNGDVGSERCASSSGSLTPGSASGVSHC